VAPRVFRRWWFWTAIGLTVLAVTVVVGFIAAVPMSSDTLRRRMIATLSERFDSAVELGDLQVRVFPGLRAEGKDLIIRKNGRTDVPPLIAIKGFSVDASMTGLWRKHVSHVQLEGLEISVPPDHGDLNNHWKESSDKDKGRRAGSADEESLEKTVVIDTLETLFTGLANLGILRAELRRLFRWLKEKGVTAVITAERGNGSLTRHGLEEYVSDCVLLLDHRVEGQISTRRLRIVKYRGSSHGTNEFPFLIDEGGICVLPITSLQLQHKASSERISSGVPALDAMLGGPGFYEGSSVLVSGTAGIGKTSLAFGRPSTPICPHPL
jgi:archaellum biogenesis ATPase FlaH